MCVADRRCIGWSIPRKGYGNGGYAAGKVFSTTTDRGFWGCATHQTPRGETCRWCLDQGDLFGRSDVPAQQTWRRKR
jgi:hypothetical protein